MLCVCFACISGGCATNPAVVVRTPDKPAASPGAEDLGIAPLTQRHIDNLQICLERTRGLRGASLQFDFTVLPGGRAQRVERVHSRLVAGEFEECVKRTLYWIPFEYSAGMTRYRIALSFERRNLVVGVTNLDAPVVTGHPGAKPGLVPGWIRELGKEEEG
jgi:hypothetical protein